MTKRRLQKGQRIKHTDRDGRIEFGSFSHYRDLFRDGREVVFGYWGDKEALGWVEPHEVVEYGIHKYTINSINQDIIKLIESGYEFKTFWGTTFDGKEFHVEVEDDCL